MQRAAATNASKESSKLLSTGDSHIPSPKRQRVSTEDPSSTPPLSDLEAISAAVAAEEDKRREALARQAAEAGESEWVLDFSGAAAETADNYPPPPFVVSAGSLDDGDELLNGGRQSYGNFKKKKKVCCLLLCLPVSLLIRKFQANAWIDNINDDGSPEDSHADELINEAKAQAKKQKSQVDLRGLSSISGSGHHGPPPSKKSQKKRKHR